MGFYSTEGTLLVNNEAYDKSRTDVQALDELTGWRGRHTMHTRPDWCRFCDNFLLKLYLLICKEGYRVAKTEGRQGCLRQWPAHYTEHFKSVTPPAPAPFLGLILKVAFQLRRISLDSAAGLTSCYSVNMTDGQGIQASRLQTLKMNVTVQKFNKIRNYSMILLY